MGCKVKPGVTAALCSALAVLSACNSDTSVDPAAGVAITVDSSVDHLQQFFGSYEINVKSTVANRSDHDIFIAQNCRNGRRLRQSDPAEERQRYLASMHASKVLRCRTSV